MLERHFIYIYTHTRNNSFDMKLTEDSEGMVYGVSITRAIVGPVTGGQATIRFKHKLSND